MLPILKRPRLLLALILLAICGALQAQPSPFYSHVHDFGGQTLEWLNGQTGEDGNEIESGFVIDPSGNMFGVAMYGGPDGDPGFGDAGDYGTPGYGMVWEITNTGFYRDIHDFGHTTTNSNGMRGPDGKWPIAQVTLDSQGNLYGSTSIGGLYGGSTSGGGVVWEITKAGVYKDLHDFGGTITLSNGSQGKDGYAPSSVVFDSSGNMFGAAADGLPFLESPIFDEGPVGTGMIWEITKSGKYLDLHDFGGRVRNASGVLGPDGLQPTSVALDRLGNLYGTTNFGGPKAPGAGIVWELTTSGAYRDLHDFGGSIPGANGGAKPDGANPFDGVTIDASGNIFGTTANGGALVGPGNPGMVWEITSSGSYKDLHDFGGQIFTASGRFGPDGTTAGAKPTLDSAGNLYGTAYLEGPYNGMVWEITTAGVYEDLHDFVGDLNENGSRVGYDGSNPRGEVTIDKFGNVLGTTENGGTLFPYQLMRTDDNGGIAWKIGNLLKGVSVGPTVAIGSSSIGTVFLSSTAPAGGTVVDLASSNPNVTVPFYVTVPAGAVSTTFTVKTSAGALGSAVITAKQGAAFSSTVSVVSTYLDGVVFLPDEVFGGQSALGVVYLNNPAPAGGVTVHLASNSASLAVPATVFIPAGSVDVVFTATTSPVKTLTNAEISATYAGVTVSGPLTLLP